MPPPSLGSNSISPIKYTHEQRVGIRQMKLLCAQRKCEAEELEALKFTELRTKRTVPTTKPLQESNIPRSPVFKPLPPRPVSTPSMDNVIEDKEGDVTLTPRKVRAALAHLTPPSRPPALQVSPGQTSKSDRSSPRSPTFRRHKRKALVFSPNSTLKASSTILFGRKEDEKIASSSTCVFH
ncbi:hypothetical protein BDN70DRAFT_901081 [Pholiota conissans]|uniref:Uncharacterized protein n=1 Tax=Pholiota conissans TaxID=109636 RepID=A0A9P6CS48_9AGAR|nr:hypothetical protein BDN70DRAFT_901081 [Pholiota conissans]